MILKIFSGEGRLGEQPRHDERLEWRGKLEQLGGLDEQRGEQLEQHGQSSTSKQ
jgi:hypothetical protein